MNCISARLLAHTASAEAALTEDLTLHMLADGVRADDVAECVADVVTTVAAAPG